MQTRLPDKLSRRREVPDIDTRRHSPSRLVTRPDFKRGSRAEKWIRCARFQRVPDTILIFIFFPVFIVRYEARIRWPNGENKVFWRLKVGIARVDAQD
jgi:hypothetical protein